MRVVVRVDASARIGVGHLVRCHTLARRLRERGARVHFICREHAGHLIDQLSADGFGVTRLPAPPESSARGEDHALWLGVSQDEDARQSALALASAGADWLVVDHYGLDACWERQLRPSVGRLMVIDDLANRPHDCDLLLDQNFSLVGAARYQHLVPEPARLLLGPRYALLGPSYRGFRALPAEPCVRAGSVFAFLGGADLDNATGRALEAMSAPALRHLTLDLVVGINNPHREAILRQAEQRPNTRVHAPRPQLADLMAKADLAIGAGGATTWERLCLGLPSLVISIADNQRPACEALARAGLIHYAGHAGEVSTGNLVAMLSALADDAAERERLAIAGRALVDGFGAARVVEALAPTALDAMWLRPEQSDAGQLSSAQLMAVDLPLVHVALEPSVNDELAVELTPEPGLTDARVEHLALREVAALARSRSRRSLGRCGGEDCLDLEPTPFLRRRGLDPTPDATYSIAIVSDASSWINDWLPGLIGRWLDAGHRVLWAHALDELRAADFCFYLSCGRIVDAETRARFRHNLVVHESDLPRGKGWSPLTWQVLEGRSRIAVTLFEAADQVDSGIIYAQKWIELEGHELVDELRRAQAEATFQLCEEFVRDSPRSAEQGREQSGAASFYPRRRPRDSALDPQLPLAAQFSLLRVCDNERYPAFFELNGCAYDLAISKRGD